MPEIFGIEQFWINGVATGLRGTATMHLPGDVRTTHMNLQGGIAGFASSPRPATIEIDVNDRGDLSVDELNNLTNATIIAVAKIGKSYSLSNAYREGDPLSIDIVEGHFSMKIAGDYSPELIAGLA